MNCPQVDKLSQYVGELLEKEEMNKLRAHILECKECQRVVEAFRGEEQYIKETLKTPSLPDDFEVMVLNQLEPYQPRRKKKWKKRVVSAVAGIVVALGLTATFNPSFAEWVGGLFSTEQVDEGLRLASDAGFVVRVDEKVTDEGLTLHVEDVVADPSRLALSYQLVREDGKILNSYLDFHDNGNEIMVLDDHGKPLEIFSMGWTSGGDQEYGMIELSVRGQEHVEKLTVTMNLVEIRGIKGNWKLDIPVDLTESKKSTKTLVLEDKQTVQHGVDVRLKEVRFAPSAHEILYETAFTEEEKNRIQEDIRKLEEAFGQEQVHTFTHFNTDLQYHLENEEGTPLFYHNVFEEGQGHPIDVGLLQGSGEGLDSFGGNAWSQSFIPQKDSEKLTFVLDGIVKTVPANFSIKIKPRELKHNPLSFEFEGNHMLVKKAGKKNDYSLRKSWIPIEKDTYFSIEMEGGREAPFSGLGSWVVVDDKGNTYATNFSGSILDETDEHGRYKTTIELRVDEMEEVPEELTLHLISVTRYEELEEKWKVPLY